MERLIGIDYGVMYAVGAQHRPWLTPALTAYTRMGDTLTLTLVVLAGVALLVALGRRAEGRGLLAAGLLCLLLDTPLKYAVGRERPDVVWRVIDLPARPSFPSGHAMGALAVYGVLGLFLTRGLKPAWLRTLLVALAFAAALLVGVTRVYLGVHWPLDVLGGWMCGVLAVLIALAVSAPPPGAGTAPPPDSAAGAYRPG